MHDGGRGADTDLLIERDLAPGVALVALLGEHDLACEDRLRCELDRLLDAGSSVVVDVADTSFIDVSVLRALYGAHRKAAARRRSLVIAWGTTEAVRRLFVLTGMLERIPHAEGRERAIRLAQERAS